MDATIGLSVEGCERLVKKTSNHRVEDAEAVSAFFEADQQFRDQFDPEHPSYHNGDSRLVPVDDVKRIPLGATEFSDNTLPAIQSQGVMCIAKVRAELAKLRKRINAVATPIQMLSAIQADDKDGETEAEKIEVKSPQNGKTNEGKKKAISLRDAAISECESSMPILKQLNEEFQELLEKQEESIKPLYEKALVDLKKTYDESEIAIYNIVILTSHVDRFTSQESFGFFLIALNTNTRRIYAQTNVLLQHIKLLKAKTPTT